MRAPRTLFSDTELRFETSISTRGTKPKSGKSLAVVAQSRVGLSGAGDEAVEHLRLLTTGPLRGSR
jgi:hypothetical protein